MTIRPNKSVIEARVKRIVPATDGLGAEVVVDVQKCRPADDLDDFIGVKPGAELTLFTAEPDELESGKTYRLTARVLGGPNGERVVIEGVEPKRKRPR